MSRAPSFSPDPDREEVKNMDSTNTKRRKIPPRELRIKVYNDVLRLRKRGLSITEIREEIHRKRGVWIGTMTISRWLRGVSSPYNGRWIPSLELLKPSEDLGYVIGVRLGDGYTYKTVNHDIIGLAAKDREFVEDFGRRLGTVLGRAPIRPRKYAGHYVVEAVSKTLYELLRSQLTSKGSGNTSSTVRSARRRFSEGSLTRRHISVRRVT